MRRIKIAHVVTQLELGGAQQNTLYTVGHLNPEAFDVLLISGPGGMLDARLPSRASFRFHFIPGLARPVNPLKDLAALWRLLRRERPDIVHTHSSKAGILGRWAAFFAGVPVIVHTYHGFGFHDFLSPAVRVFYIFLEKICAGLSARLIFVSRQNQATARSAGIGRPERYELIRSGVPLKNFPAKIPDPKTVKAALGVGMHKPLVLSVGNFKAQKNPEDFIRLAKMLHPKFPEARFLFIGDGARRPLLESMVLREGVDGVCLLPGWRADVPEILAAADVFVMTSLWEGLPRSLVEAMKSGLGCVCYAVDGVRELIEDGRTGFLVAPRGVETMAARVEALLRDPSLREKIGAQAAGSIGEEFDIDAMVLRQEALYAKLVREQGRFVGE